MTQNTTTHGPQVSDSSSTYRDDPFQLDTTTGVIEAQQHLDRRLGFWVLFSMAICMGGTWEGISVVIFQGFRLGGAPAVLWGYVVTAICMSCVAATLAEISSIWPSSGSVYHWTAELCPKRFRLTVSYYVVWLNIAGLFLCAVAMILGAVMQIQGAAMITFPDYALSAQRWHLTLIHWGLLTVHLVMNVFGLKLFNSINIASGIAHFAFFFITMVVLLATTKHKNTPKTVFVDFRNSSGWDNNGIAFLISLITACGGFGGLHSIAMYSEEAKNAPIAISRAMCYATMINGLICFPWVLSLLFCMGSLDEVLQLPTTNISPMAVIYAKSTGSKGAAAFLQAVLFLLGACSSMDVVGATGRAIYTAARDKALPPILAEIHPKWHVPVYSILVGVAPMYLISLIYIWNATAFYAFLSAFVFTQMLSYFIPMALMTYQCRQKGFRFGPWQLGRARLAIQSIALCFSVILMIFPALFPTALPVTAANMNYSVVIQAGILLLATLLYFFYAAKRFTGPGQIQIVNGVKPEVVYADSISKENVLDISLRAEGP